MSDEAKYDKETRATVERLSAITRTYAPHVFGRYMLILIALVFVLSSFMFLAAAKKYVDTRNDALTAAKNVESLRAELDTQRKDLDRSAEERQQEAQQWEQEKIILQADIAKLGKSAKQLQPIARLSTTLMNARQLFASHDYVGAGRKYEEAFSLSEGADSDILNQSAWSYYIAGTKSDGDSSTYFSHARGLFELGVKEFPDNIDLRLNYILFRAERDGISTSVVDDINELARVDPSKAAVFAGAPQTRRLRASGRDSMFRWRECLINVASKSGGSDKQSVNCRLEIDDQNRPLFVAVMPT